MIEDHSIEVEVVLWHGSRDATAGLPGLATLLIRTDDERALASATEVVRDRTGFDTAILELTKSHLHLEMLSPDRGALEWRAPTVPIAGTAPWNLRGWFTTTQALIRDALRNQVGATQIGRVRQVKHWSISALVEAESDAGTFWFKQVPRFMAHEAALTSWLSAIRPGAVPDVVAAGADWFLAPAFDPPTEERRSDSPFGLLAELQIAVQDRVADLLALGCPDRRPATMGQELRSLIERDDVLEPALSERLSTALPRFDELVEGLEASPVPASLAHGDLHGGNWTQRSDGSWLIFDWTDGCVAHPFVDLGVLPHQDPELRDARLEEYLGPWRAAFGADAVASTLEAALPVAAAFHALSYVRIVDGVDAAGSEGWKPAVRSYLGRLLDALG